MGQIITDDILKWLMSGDPAVRYQTKRDLPDADDKELETLQRDVAREGWGKELLALRDPETGKWGGGWYTPKWISTHYTLLLLKKMDIHPETPEYVESARLLLDHLWFDQGLVRKDLYQDMCVSGMLLGICAYGKIESPKLHEITDYILQHHFNDGGWNCSWNRGATHSSLHTTLSILEAIRDYEDSGYTYRRDELISQRDEAHEFILRHRLYKSERTGEIIKKQFLMLSFPDRWKYNILRCLDYFQSVDLPYDPCMEDALGIILKKRRKDGTWPLQHKIQGLVHFDMEETGKPSRWNTLRALRVLKKYTIYNG